MSDDPFLLERHDVVAARDGEGPDLLVLWVSPDRSALAAVDRARIKDMPTLWAMAEVVAMVGAGAWVVTQGRQPSQRLDWELNDVERARRDRAYAVVRGIVDGNEPGVYVPGPRGRLVTLACAASGFTGPSVRAWLLRYFHGGMTRDSLVPRYERCGAPGVARVAARGAPKRGRPAAPGHPVGTNVTAEVRQWFTLAVDVGYARRREHDLTSAYQLCVQRFLSVRAAAEDGSVTFAPRPEFAGTGMPTLSQFLYWFRRDQVASKVGRRREGARAWEMANRALLRTATAQTTGPGMRYEIDATVLDVYVRSRRRRRRLVGRPTLYLVVDVWSRMIVGIYVSLEHPSWVAASMALANAIEDKVAFCKRHGVEIEERDWPVRHLCAVVLGDKGEMAKSGVEGILETFRVRVENAASYHGDWKPIVERRFGTTQQAYAPYVDGYVLPDFRQRGAPDYRDGAVLDLDDVTRIIIRVVLYFNNHHELRGYPRQEGQVEDGVPSVPVDLWSWGLANRTGSPRIPKPERFRFALLPRARGTVTPQGILFQGRYYVAEVALREGWFERARGAQFHVDLSYDKRDVDRVYLHDRRAEHGFEVADLSRDRSAEHLGLTGWESHALQVDYKAITADRRDGQALARAAMNAEVARINAEAVERLPPRPNGVSRAAERRGVREARAEHVAENRVGEVLAFRPGGSSSRAAGAPPPVGPGPSVGTALPSIADLRRAMRDDED